jgi:hypothetical protein
MVLRLLKRLGGLCLAVLLLSLSGYVFVVGVGRLALWWVAQQPDQYAVAYPYLLDAVPWMAFGLLGLIGSLAVITNGQRSLRWLLFPAVTLLYCIVLSPLQPNNGWFFHHARHPMSTMPIAWAQDRTRWDFLQITGDLTKQAKSRGAFSCPGDAPKVPSRFTSGGQTLLYEVRCVDLGIHNAINPPTRAAVILIRLSKDRQVAWFQATTLMQDMGGAVTWLSNYGGVDFVIHESIKEDINST